jgi:hypothetical protein
VVRVIDIECDLPTAEAYEFRAAHSSPPVLGSGDTFRGRQAVGAAGHGMVNYLNIFGPGYAAEVGMSPAEFAEKRRTMDGGVVRRSRRLAAKAMSPDEFAGVLVRAGVARAVVGTAQPSTTTVSAVQQRLTCSSVSPVSRVGRHGRRA